MKLLYCLALVGCCLSVNEATKWTHIGANGRTEWASLFPDCAGKSQSPIDLDSTGDDESFQFSPDLTNDLDIVKGQDVENYYLFNNAHSAVVDTSGAEVDVFGANLGSTYRVVGPHFHWGAQNDRGSEHTFNGIEYPLEMHIVTYNKEKFDTLMDAATSGEKGALAVVGVMFKLADEENPKLKPITDFLSQIVTPDKENKVPIPAFDLKSMLPDETSEYFRYSGSLTTPQCNEIVTWTVLLHPEPVSQSQMDAFRALNHAEDGDNFESLVDNYRPVQPLNGRTVYTSFKEPSIDLPVKGKKPVEEGTSGETDSQISGAAHVTASTLVMIFAMFLLL